MKKITIYLAVFFTLVFLSGVFTRYLGTLLGAAPEFFLIFVAISSLLEGPYYGIIFGFAAGLMADFFSVFLPGANCLIYTTVGYVAGSLKGRFYAETIRNQIILVGGAFLFHKISLALIAQTFGVRYAISSTWFILTFIYDAVCAPLIFHFCKKIISITSSPYR